MTTIFPTPFPELLQRLEVLRLEVGRHRTMWLLDKSADRELRADMSDQLVHTMDLMCQVERAIETLNDWINEKEEA